MKFSQKKSTFINFYELKKKIKKIRIHIIFIKERRKQNILLFFSKYLFFKLKIQEYHRIIDA